MFINTFRWWSKRCFNDSSGRCWNRVVRAGRDAGSHVQRLCYCTVQIFTPPVACSRSLELSEACITCPLLFLQECCLFSNVFLLNTFYIFNFIVVFKNFIFFMLKFWILLGLFLSDILVSNILWVQRRKHDWTNVSSSLQSYNNWISASGQRSIW